MVSGAHRYAANTARALCSREDVHLTSVVHPSDLGRLEALGYPPASERHDIVEIRQSLVHSWSLAAWYVFWPRFLVWRHRLDVAHITNARFVVGNRLVQTLHDVAEEFVEHKYSRLRTLYRRNVVHAQLRRCRKVITVSESARTDIAARLAISPERIVVIENVDTLADRSLREVHESGIDGDYFLVVGRIDHPSKNLVMLIRAYSCYRRRGGVAKLVLAGPASFGAEAVVAEALASEFCSDIQFLGFVSDARLASLYDGATALCFPSLHEGFGIPALEALGRAVPVLFSDTGALREVVGSDVGMLRGDDVDAWTEALRSVSDPDVRKQWLLAQLEGSPRRKTLAEIGDDLVAVYEECGRA